MLSSLALIPALLAALQVVEHAPLPARAAVNRAVMVLIPAGKYVPLYNDERGRESTVHVKTFWLDREPVTRGAFLEFVRVNPEWRRSRVSRLKADRVYLAGWKNDLDAGSAMDKLRPATQISWFAAKAYCEWRGARLPTVDEWEYVAAASTRLYDASRDSVFMRELLAVYTKPRIQPPATGNERPNKYGVAGMHSYGWEWVLDFNSVMVSDDSRRGTGLERDMFCASSAIGATGYSNYPAFLRYAVRAKLMGSTTLETLGFRCAQG